MLEVSETLPAGGAASGWPLLGGEQALLGAGRIAGESPDPSGDQGSSGNCSSVPSSRSSSQPRTVWTRPAL